jgi:hypothetical protein
MPVLMESVVGGEEDYWAVYAVCGGDGTEELLVPCVSWNAAGIFLCVTTVSCDVYPIFAPSRLSLAASLLDVVTKSSCGWYCLAVLFLPTVAHNWS